MRDRAERVTREQVEPEAASPERPAPEAANPLLALQAQAGNLAVQAKLTVGAVHDPAELEADRIADQVVRNLDADVVPRNPLARTIRRKAMPGHGPDGGDVDEGVARQIDSARGKGKALDEGTRGRMESAFGTDLSGVRVHTGGEADGLSKSLNARAFTTGEDVFFANGEYDPSSKSGQTVLAHELAHTVQQTGGAKRLQRLTVHGTNWEGVTSARVSSGGGFGAGIFDDGAGPIIVKPGEEQAAELLMTANAVGGLDQSEEPAKKGKKKGKKDDSFMLSTPGARIADKDEASRIKDAFETHADPAALETERTKKWLARLDQASTLIFEFAGGMDFSDHMKAAGTVKGKGKKKEVDKKSPLGSFLTQPGQLEALGLGSGVDLFMGNGDRIAGYFNPENWKTDYVNKTIHLIDNAQKIGKNFLVDSEFYSAREGFQAWFSNNMTKNFAKGDFEALAEYCFNMMDTGIRGAVNNDDANVVDTLYRKQRPKMKQWFIKGLAKGRERLMVLLNDPMKLVQGVPAEIKQQALTSAYARKFALNGMAEGPAWEAAEKIAEKRLKPQEQEQSQAPKSTWQRGRKPSDLSNVS